MIKLMLEAEGVRAIGVGADKYLIVRESNKYFFVQSDNSERIRLQAGDTLDIADLKSLEISNPHDESIEIVYQVVRREMVTNKNAVVTFGSQLEVSGINSTVSVKDTPSQTIHTPLHITVQVGGTVKLTTANPLRKELLVQHISDEATEVLVGDSSVSANRGMPVTGERRYPAGINLSARAEAWAFNNGDAVATLAVMEVVQ